MFSDGKDIKSTYPEVMQLKDWLLHIFDKELEEEEGSSMRKFYTATLKRESNACIALS